MQPANPPRPELASVRTHGPTFLESKQLDEQGEQTSFSQMELHDLSVDRVTGEIGGVGPGWVHHVSRGSSPQMVGPQAAAPGLGQPVALPAAPAIKDEGFTYLSVNFRRKLEGNLNRRVLRFLDKTRTVYGPVAGWNDKLQPNDLDSLGPNGIVLDAHTLEVREMNKRPNSKRGWFELDATGDVMAQGQRLTAQGERLTYSEEKDQMVLRGDPAEIFVENENGGGRQETRAREVRYWFTRNYCFGLGRNRQLDIAEPHEGREVKSSGTDYPEPSSVSTASRPVMPTVTPRACAALLTSRILALNRSSGSRSGLAGVPRAMATTRLNSLAERMS